MDSHLKAAAAAFATVAAAVGLLSQIDSFVATKSEFDKLEARFDRHVEQGSEDRRLRNQRWRDLGFDPGAGRRTSE